MLRDATPGAGVLGEEEGTTSAGARVQWVVDPLDGTINFLYGVPLFAVSIAAAVDGEVVAGAGGGVLRDELFSAPHGGGGGGDREAVAGSLCAAPPPPLPAAGVSS